MIKHNKTILLFLFWFSVSPVLFAQSPTEELNEFLSLYKSRKGVPSISAGVARDNKIIWLRAEGYGDLENNVPATSKSIYRIASISKCITAVAVMQLVEQNKIDLDADVRKYIPYFPKKKWIFTVRQLLNHTSGIRNYRTGEFDNKNFFPDTKFAVNFIAKDSLEYEPGTRYLYTTLGYNLLAAIIENVTGRKFIDYLRRNIFEPAGMISTYADYQSDIIPYRARGYEKNNFRQIQNAPLADLSIKFAGGGLISTASDLLQFSLALLNDKLIKKETLDSMLVPTRLKNGDKRNYGLGFAFGKDKHGENFISHAGGGTGFTSLLVIYPETKLIAVHLINIRDRDLGEPAFDLASIVRNYEYLLPVASLADTLLHITQNSSLDSALAFYEFIKFDSAHFPTDKNDDLVTFGNDLIKTGRVSDAINFFKYFIRLAPDYAKGYQGLADAYYKDGNKGLAIKHFRTVLKMDPMNFYASQMVKKLSGS